MWQVRALSCSTHTVEVFVSAPWRTDIFIYTVIIFRCNSESCRGDLERNCCDHPEHNNLSFCPLCYLFGSSTTPTPCFSFSFTATCYFPSSTLSFFVWACACDMLSVLWHATRIDTPSPNTRQGRTHRVPAMHYDVALCSTLNRMVFDSICVICDASKSPSLPWIQ